VNPVPASSEKQPLARWENNMSDSSTNSNLRTHEVVSPEVWLERRKQLLNHEKELTRLRDEISRQRRELPWEEVTKTYVFDGPDGKQTLAQLFGGKSQLIVYHFMFGPGWNEGCVGCSFLADHLDGALQHVQQKDIAVVLVSRAPFAEIEAFKKRMGWNFKWVSSNGSEFNYDYRVSFKPEEVASGSIYYNYENRSDSFLSEDMSGTSVFYKADSGKIFHTYSSYARGGEELLGSYSLIDLTPKGRQENGPTLSLGDWVRHHDRYHASGFVDPTGRYREATIQDLVEIVAS
jgi:predicted dithiol-disulfide oxidoreductase (DUF899 family)